MKARARTARVAVHYPLERGRIVLRSDVDWERDIQPVRAPRPGRPHEFVVPLTNAHCSFKPVLLDKRGGPPRWAQGENCLAWERARGPNEVWPYFDPDSSCHVCTRHRPPSSGDGQDHDVRVYLPPGYDENELLRYPVVYLQDGHNCFFAEESFAGETWRVQETLRLLQDMALTRAVIAVGIVPRERTAEYTAPGYVEYGRYLAETLKPWVDRNYRTLPQARTTLVMGSSLGGVASLHTAWTHPEEFGNAACLSSTFGWSDDLLERVRSGPRPDLRLYLDSGWPHDNYEATRCMRDALAQRGFRPGRELFYLAYPKATHDEKSWALRAHVPFQWFFGPDGA
jgi:predicted alpha/beta superfamily hydrolase